MTPLVLKNTRGYLNFLEEHEALAIEAWAMENYKTFDSTDLGIYLGHIPPELKTLVDSIETRLRDLEGLWQYRPDPHFGCRIGYHAPGSKLSLHNDPDQPDGRHVRYNAMVTTPTQGGYSIYGRARNWIPRLAVWRCEPNKYRHGVTRIQGPRPRIVLSMGYIIPYKDLPYGTDQPQT